MSLRDDFAESRWRALARIELACNIARDLEDEVALAIRSAKRAGATWKELQIASGMKLPTLRRIVGRKR